MSILNIRIVRSSNPRTPDYVRIRSAVNRFPSSASNLYFTGDLDPYHTHKLTERYSDDVLRTIESYISVSNTDRVKISIQSSKYVSRTGEIRFRPVIRKKAFNYLLNFYNILVDGESESRGNNK